MKKITMVLRIKGLSEERIQEHFTEFFSGLVEKYPNQFGVGVSVLIKETEGEKKVLEIADLD